MIDHDASAFVYFIRPVGGGPTKIGAARSPSERFATIQACSPLRLRLLAVMPGGFNLELELHNRFRADRLHGEWFRSSPALDSLIRDAGWELVEPVR